MGFNAGNQKFFEKVRYGGMILNPEAWKAVDMALHSINSS